MQHFTQLQDVLGRQRAAMEGQAVSIIMFALIFSTIKWKGVREIVHIKKGHRIYFVKLTTVLAYKFYSIVKYISHPIQVKTRVWS